MPLKAKGRKGNQHAHIAAATLSPSSPDFVWVGCSDGRIWRLNWTTGSTEELKTRNGSQLTDMTVQAVTIAREPQEILFASETVGDSAELVAYDIADLNNPETRRLYEHTSQIQMVRSVPGAGVLVAATERGLIVGELDQHKTTTFQNLKYRFASFDTSDEITALDIRLSERRKPKKIDEARKSDRLLVDVVVGCIRGAIFVYGDILQEIRQAETKKSQPLPMQPRKHHWHRKAVHCVKWSKTGMSLPDAFLAGADGQRCILHIRWLGNGSCPMAD